MLRLTRARIGLQGSAASSLGAPAAPAATFEVLSAGGTGYTTARDVLSAAGSSYSVPQAVLSAGGSSYNAI